MKSKAAVKKPRKTKGRRYAASPHGSWSSSTHKSKRPGRNTKYMPRVAKGS